MRIVKIGSSVLTALAVVVLFAAPIGPLPGVFIGGTATPAPTTWEDTSAIDEVRLRVPGLVPRVVIIWVIDVAGELYVLGMKDGGWTGMIGDGADVDLRIEDRTYGVRATPVSEGTRAIIEAYLAKYEPNYPDLVEDLRSLEDTPEVAAVFRLERS